MQQNTDAVVLLTTVPNEQCGKDLANQLLSARLAACINLLPEMSSMYYWQDKIECDTEHQMLIKTNRKHLTAIEQLMQKHHPYDIPELIVLEITSGSNDYLNWMNNLVQKS